MSIQAGMILLAVAGFVTACRTPSSIAAGLIAALKVGALSGLMGGSILFFTSMGMTVTYHDAMMQDPGNVHEYRLSAPEPPTREQLSSFLYWDALGGALNMMWITPLAGAILGDGRRTICARFSPAFADGFASHLVGAVWIRQWRGGIPSGLGLAVQAHAQS
jgi:hypothetical protein